MITVLLWRNIAFVTRRKPSGIFKRTVLKNHLTVYDENYIEIKIILSSFQRYIICCSFLYKFRTYRPSKLKVAEFTTIAVTTDTRFNDCCVVNSSAFICVWYLWVLRRNIHSTRRILPFICTVIQHSLATGRIEYSVV
jgi:hypothetical protein